MSLKVRMSEVEEHKDGKGGVWTVIHNKVLPLLVLVPVCNVIHKMGLLFLHLSSQHHVYDVTAFLAEHPGGAAILEENSGVDIWTI